MLSAGIWSFIPSNWVDMFTRWYHSGLRLLSCFVSWFVIECRNGKKHEQVYSCSEEGNCYAPTYIIYHEHKGVTISEMIYFTFMVIRPRIYGSLVDWPSACDWCTAIIYPEGRCICIYEQQYRIIGFLCIREKLDVDASMNKHARPLPILLMTATDAIGRFIISAWLCGQEKQMQ